MYSPLTKALIDALKVLPGVGEKSAQRMALHLLADHNRSKGLALANALTEAMQHIKQCQHCRNYCEQPVCDLCADNKRDPLTICIVQTPQDLFALEQTHSFRGRYFVLHGSLSPLDGIGPEDIGLNILEHQLAKQPVDELVLATNSTVEGEATAQYIAAVMNNNVKRITRIAHGVPMGGELEFLDGSTLGHAFNQRQALVTNE